MSTETRHTPKPWRICKSEENAKNCMILGPPYIDDEGLESELIIATMQGRDDEQLANRRLIAAAPETKRQRDALLAACERAHDAVQSLPQNALGRDDKLGHYYRDELLSQLHEAIAATEDT